MKCADLEHKIWSDGDSYDVTCALSEVWDDREEDSVQMSESVAEEVMIILSEIFGEQG